MASGADYRGEVEHPADRQIDLADRQQKDHADRQHAEKGVVAVRLSRLSGSTKAGLIAPMRATRMPRATSTPSSSGSRRCRRRSRGSGSSWFVASRSGARRSGVAPSACSWSITCPAPHAFPGHAGHPPFLSRRGSGGSCDLDVASWLIAHHQSQSIPARIVSPTFVGCQPPSTAQAMEWPPSMFST